MNALIAALLLGAQPMAPQVVIDNAANGGLRDWQSVPGAPGELYVRDRTERWYRVRLSAPCERYRPSAAMSYTTDPNGNFDRFSFVHFVGAGPGNCAVESITRSAAPPQFDSKAAHRG